MSNITVGGNQTVSKNSIIGGDLLVGNNVSIGGNIQIKKNMDISSDILVGGILTVKNDFEIQKNLRVNGNLFQLGLINSSPKEYGVDLSIYNRKLGINIPNPSYTLDIVSTGTKGFSVQSSTSSNYNVIARNNNYDGVVAKTDLSRFNQLF
jgi:hypothetical protein